MQGIAGSSSMQRALLRSLEELQQTLAWVLLSLAHSGRARKKKKRKKAPKHLFLSPLPIGRLLSWLYAAVQHCAVLVEEEEASIRVALTIKQK